MKRREFMMLGSGVAALAWSRPSFAQQGAGIKRLGFLIGQAERDADAQRRFGAFVERLRELGWKDGDTLHIEQRWVAGDPELRQRYVAELVALAPDAIATSGTPQLNELSRATRTIPVVFMSVSDPVGLAFVASLAHPGGNITGFANFEPAMAGKWLELLKETDPRIVRVVLLHTPRIAPIGASILRLLEAAAQHFGVSVTSAPVQDSADIERAIPAAAAEGNKRRG